MNNGTATSVRLLRRYKDGDSAALSELLERQIRPMRREPGRTVTPPLTAQLGFRFTF